MQQRPAIHIYLNPLVLIFSDNSLPHHKFFIAFIGNKLIASASMISTRENVFLFIEISYHSASMCYDKNYRLKRKYKKIT